MLLGWAFDVTALKTVLPGLFAMQPWAAITIALAGGALLVATVPGGSRLPLALAGAVLIIGLQMLLQHATGLDFGTDRWFFPEAVGNQPGHPHPGRVAEVTSIAFVLLGAMLLLARVERAWARVVFSTIGTVGLLLMAAPLLGYLIGAGILQSAAFFTPIALHAALGLVVLFLGALALRPDTGWMALLSGDMPGATSARMLLPVAVAGPVLLAWLFTSGKQAGLYGPDFQVGLITLATIALLGNALLWNAARLDRLHRARLAAAEALRQSEERYRSLVEAQPDPICQFLPDTTLTFVNRAYAQFYGTEPEELIGRRWLDFAPRTSGRGSSTSCRRSRPSIRSGTRKPAAPGPDREVRWYLCHLYGFFDDAGKIVSFQTFGTDITPRKRIEEQLAEQLGLLTAITDSAADAIFVSDCEERVTLMNPAAERIFGWSRQADGPKTARRHSRPSPGRPPLSGVRMPAQPCLRDRRDAPPARGRVLPQGWLAGPGRLLQRAAHDRGPDCRLRAGRPRHHRTQADRGGAAGERSPLSHRRRSHPLRRLGVQSRGWRGVRQPDIPRPHRQDARRGETTRMAGPAAARGLEAYPGCLA